MAEVQTTVKKDNKAVLKLQREKDREIVRGIFRFYEVPGGSIKFSYKKYKEDPVETFELKDGEVYSIPLGVAKHLNKNCYQVEHAYTTDENGAPSTKVGRKIQRCGFQSLEFIPEEDLQEAGSNLYTVEKVL